MLTTVGLERIPANIIPIEFAFKQIYLIPIERNEATFFQDLHAHLQQIHPDTCCIELTYSQYEFFEHSHEWEEMNILSVIRNDKWIWLLTDLIYIHFIRKLRLNPEKSKGQDLCLAANFMKARQIQLEFVDQEITVLAKRAWRFSSFREKFLLIGNIAQLLFTTKDLSKEEIFHIKKTYLTHSLYTSIIALLCKKMAHLSRFFKDERIMFISHKILNAPGNRIIVYLHPSHVQPVQSLLKVPFLYSSEIEAVPPANRAFQVLFFLIPCFLLLAVVLIGVFKSKALAIEMIGIWILLHAVFTSLLALIFLSHPMTILSCWILSPLTSLNTFVSALLLVMIESFFRKPRVKDLESLGDDIKHMTGYFKNRILKLAVLLGAILVGGLSATFIALTVIAKWRLF